MSTPSHLLIDAGNQRLKWRVDGVDGTVNWPSGSEFPNCAWADSGRGGKALVASVRSSIESSAIAETLKERGYQVSFPRVVAEQNGLICGYRDSSQLGVDRWLAMLACWEKLQSGFIFVGAGTALTIDLVYNTGKHGGGYIAAGLGLAREALLRRSEKLRDQYAETQAKLEPGKDTASAINNGALFAGVEFIRGVQRSSGMGQTSLIISGGDAELFGSHFPGASVWNNIVLDGLSVWAGSATREG